MIVDEGKINLYCCIFLSFLLLEGAYRCKVLVIAPPVTRFSESQHRCDVSNLSCLSPSEAFTGVLLGLDPIDIHVESEALISTFQRT